MDKIPFPNETVSCYTWMMEKTPTTPYEQAVETAEAVIHRNHAPTIGEVINLAAVFLLQQIEFKAQLKDCQGKLRHGRRPLGDRAMTGTERSRKHRAAKAKIKNQEKHK